MKNKFKEFYKYSDAEIKKIWQECVFVFDTNVLLDLYRYNNTTSDKYIGILKKIKDENRIWIPHQVGLEFHKRRIIQIADLKNSYSKIRSILDTSIKDAQKKIEDKYHKEHPFLDLKEISNELDSCLKKITLSINKNEKSHPDWVNKDNILGELNKIFKDSIGEEYLKEKLDEIYKEGKERYSNDVPPGYKDASKDNEREYGDLILWYQIIDKANELKKPIIFITRDKKEDWWWIQSGTVIGPRHELKKEIQDKAGVDFHMYDPEKFLELAGEYYKQIVDKKILQDVKRVKSLEERNYVVHKILHSRDFKHPLFHEFIMQQGMLGEELQHLVKQLNLDDDFFIEFNRNQERVLHFIEHFSHEERPHPMMLEELFMLQERMQRRFMETVDSGKLTKEQMSFLIRFFERMNDSYMVLLKHSNKDGFSDKYFHRMEMNNHRFRKYFREFEI